MRVCAILLRHAVKSDSLTYSSGCTQLRQRQEVGGRAADAEEQQRPLNDRSTGEHGQRRGVEETALSLQGRERAHEEKGKPHPSGCKEGVFSWCNGCQRSMLKALDQIKR